VVDDYPQAHVSRDNILTSYGILKMALMEKTSRRRRGASNIVTNLMMQRMDGYTRLNSPFARYLTPAVVLTALADP